MTHVKLGRRSYTIYFIARIYSYSLNDPVYEHPELESNPMYEQPELESNPMYEHPELESNPAYEMVNMTAPSKI